MTPVSSGSSPSVSRPRSQFVYRLRSASGPYRPVTMVRRPSTPSTCPQALASSGSNVEPSASGSAVAVVLPALGPLMWLMPTESAQHSGAMLGVVPVGATTAPTPWHVAACGCVALM